MEAPWNFGLDISEATLPRIANSEPYQAVMVTDLVRIIRTGFLKKRFCGANDRGKGITHPPGVPERRLAFHSEVLGNPRRLSAAEHRLAEAAERIVQLYEAWGNKENAAPWRARPPKAAPRQSSPRRLPSWPKLRV